MLKFNLAGFSSVTLSIFALALFSFAPQADASGGIGGLSSGGSPGGGGRGPVIERDPSYELGKSVYNGRAAGVERIKYCVKVDGKLKKLKRSTTKPYRKGSVENFALALFDCADGERLALTTIDRKQVPFVLYYLNKRYKLNLQDA